MHNLYVKVCGITRLIDATRAEKFGANLLGFIFYKNSPRYISPTKAKNIIKKLSPVTSRVGVFVNEDNNKILKIAQNLSLDFIQLSGHESSRDVSYLLKQGFKVIKTIHVSTQSELQKIKKISADIIHLDTADKKLYGGSGKQFNWNLTLSKSHKNIMLAGGIKSDNVLDGIKRFNPLIVDVNSGVELKPGMKSEKMLKEFFKKVNRYRNGK